jgi:hypothetical protein
MMKTDEQIRAQVRAGQITVQGAQLEVLLDMREHLRTLVERSRKPGRPRKKKDDQKPARK